MPSKRQKPFRRPYAEELARRLAEPRRFMQVVTGARQVGKTTLVQQVTEGQGLPVRFVSADEPTLRDVGWLAEQWEAARFEVGSEGGILVVDEVQKVVNWSESVKRLWDEDTRKRRPLKVVLLGSAPLLVQRGLTESLAGRFERLHLPHWPLAEMRDAFGFDAVRSATTGSSMDGWLNPRWAPIWPMRHRAASASCSTGESATARWIS